MSIGFSGVLGPWLAADNTEAGKSVHTSNKRFVSFCTGPPLRFSEGECCGSECPVTSGPCLPQPVAGSCLPQPGVSVAPHPVVCCPHPDVACPVSSPTVPGSSPSPDSSSLLASVSLSLEYVHIRTCVEIFTGGRGYIRRWAWGYPITGYGMPSTQREMESVVQSSLVMTPLVGEPGFVRPLWGLWSRSSMGTSVTSSSSMIVVGIAGSS